MILKLSNLNIILKPINFKNIDSIIDFFNYNFSSENTEEYLININNLKLKAN